MLHLDDLGFDGGFDRWGFLNRGTSKSTINHPAIGVPALEETPFYDFDISPKSFGVGYSMCNSCISEVVTCS